MSETTLTFGDNLTIEAGVVIDNDDIRDAVVKAAVAAERERCIAVIRQYLLFDSQRAVSWHEIQDCINAIRAGS